jgi:Activator of Hsp90 ATPase homolog 1-like protein
MPGQRIVQSWRTADFTEEHEDSIVTLTLEEIEDGTLLTLAHSNVPDGQTGYELGGWEENYFEPMTEYFADRTRPNVNEAATRTAPSTKRAAGRKKAKRAAPRPKATASKRKSGLVAANAGRKSATKTRSKGTKSKRRR